MEKKKYLYLTLVFFIIAGAFLIVTIILAPNMSSGYFDPANIYDIIVPILVLITVIIFLIAIGFIRWWRLAH